MSVLDWVFTGASSGWGALLFEITMDEPVAGPMPLPFGFHGVVVEMIASLSDEKAEAVRIADYEWAERLCDRIAALERTQNPSGGVP